jgi:hypothetical protein
MEHQTVADIYAENARIREKLRDTVGNLGSEAAGRRAEDGKWTVAELVEHISLVDERMAAICKKLLEKARAEEKAADGKANISEQFFAKAAEIAHTKLEAPEIVRPAEGRTIAESLAKLDDNQRIMEEIRPLFEAFDGSSYKFPHPFFGDLSAQEWLALRGGHEARHLKQIKNIIEGPQE